MTGRRVGPDISIQCHHQAVAPDSGATSASSIKVPPEHTCCYGMHYMQLKRYMLQIGVLPEAMVVCMGKDDLLILLGEHQRQLSCSHSGDE